MYNTGSPYRPVEMRMREDLQVVTHVYRGETSYVVGDMLALEFYRMNDQEFALLKALDGRRSVQDIKEAFEAEFAPHRIRHSEIQQYALDFHKKALVATPNPDQGRHLQRLGRQKRIKKNVGSLKNLLALRFRGINPDAIFRAFTPWTSWFFSRAAIAASVLVMFAALALLASHFDEFARRIPSMQDFFSGRNLGLMACVLVVMKILHEFGHGIVFTKYGGRCHELGIMLLVFMPTLYVNTTDSWRLSDKWQRAAIAAAGVYVELVLAALATFGWWYSNIGTVHYVCLNVMFLGSISAMLFNGNPLLKFDGYYILSDVLEIPNLQQRSRSLVRNWFLNTAMGVREGDDYLETRSTKAWLVSYAILSYLYRFLIIYFIAFMVVQLARPLGLEDIAKMFSFLLMSLLVVAPLFGLAKYFWTPGKSQEVQPMRAKITAGLLACVLAVFFLVPLPDQVLCDFVIQPKDAETVYVQHDAVLKAVHTLPDVNVEEGDPIATLRNIDMELEIAKLEGEIRELENEVRYVRLMTHESETGTERNRTLRVSLQAARERLGELQELQTGLALVAPRAGTVVPIWQQDTPADSQGALEDWKGSTLHHENVGATFRRGQPICKIGDLTEPEARLIIDQRDIQRVRVGQPVLLLLDSNTTQEFQGKIASISEADTKEMASPGSQQYGGRIATKPETAANHGTGSSSQQPLGAVYEAMVPLPNNADAYEDGLRGTARIEVGYRTMASRVNHLLQSTFRIEL